MTVLPEPEIRTKPKPTGVDAKTDPALLTAGRYGTDDTISIFGANKTFEYILKTQGYSAEVLSELYPDVVPPEDARILSETANLRYVDPFRIRKLEQKTGHDIIAINTAWEEVVTPRSKRAPSHINKIKTSADSTEPAKALQLKEGLEVIADSVENLRDIILERALEWDSIPHMDQSHLLDALPTVVGRPFVHYAEMLQSDLFFAKFVYENSIIGKWSDATGNYHSATDMGLDGRKIEEAFCNKVGIKNMKAAAQIPGREYMMDIYYVLLRFAETSRNIADYIRWGRGSDVSIFNFPLGDKGSSAMPHKDAKGGNPRAEEQTGSLDNYMRGVMAAAMSSCSMDYARDLTGSAVDRINTEDSFKFLDHSVRNLAGVVYKLIIVPERCEERVTRSYGVVTSPRFLAYLTDSRKPNAMPRSEAHDLIGQLATQAYSNKKMFVDVLLKNEEICNRIPKEDILKMADPFTYIGQSREIIHDVYDAYHGKKTFSSFCS